MRVKRTPAVPEFLIHRDTFQVALSGVGGLSEQVPGFFTTTQGVVFKAEKGRGAGSLKGEKALVVVGEYE